jgi:predicted RND superfamily exporter protein
VLFHAHYTDCSFQVDVIGLSNLFWSQTVDTVSCVAIVLVVGFSVDYSAHIAHAFIVADGEKEHAHQETFVLSD